MNQIISDLLRTALEATVNSAVEHGISAVFDRNSAQASGYPVEDAITVMDGFMLAIAHRDGHSLHQLASPRWTVLPETVELLAHTWESAPPVDWSFDEVQVPSEWTSGTPEWVIAALTVTFEVEEGFVSIPTILRTCPGADRWQVDYLDWGSAASEPEPAPEEFAVDEGFSQAVSSLFEPVVLDAAEVVECAGCGQLLRVPTHKGQLRVSCPRCDNVQWFTP